MLEVDFHATIPPWWLFDSGVATELEAEQLGLPISCPRFEPATQLRRLQLPSWTQEVSFTGRQTPRLLCYPTASPPSNHGP
jgi:hypothetical protein